MNRINFSGPIFTTGTTIRGFDFGGRARRGFITEVSVPGGWYAVTINGCGDTAVIRFETARAV